VAWVDFIFCAFALWFGGCPKRQETRNMIVYVPAQAPAAAPANTEKSSVLVIEEPPRRPSPLKLQRPRQYRPPPSAVSQRARNHLPNMRKLPPAGQSPFRGSPLLEPRESFGQETELRRRYLNLEQNLRQACARLNGARLSATSGRRWTMRKLSLRSPRAPWQTGTFFAP